MREPSLDLLVLGATGFTGRQAAFWLKAHAPTGLRWGVAGRNPAKLAQLRTELGITDLPIQQVDTADVVAVREMAESTRVLLSTVGPFAKYGSEVFAACARAGTHYADITGETPWVRRMIDLHETTARDSGARLVPFCGFDSVPSDLGTLLVVDWIRQHYGQATRDVRSAFRAKGGVNGGTLDSAFTLAERGEERLVADAFLLNPKDYRPTFSKARHGDPVSPRKDPDLGWVAPFFMGPVNSRVVRRSQAIYRERGHEYGSDFAYQEWMSAPSAAFAYGVTGALGIGFALNRNATTRGLLRRFAPAPGEGPSEAVMDGGWFRADFVGVAEDGRKARLRIRSPGDPGNRSTVRFLCCAGLCLAAGEGPPGAGVLTPATAFGTSLAERLRNHGVDFELGPLSSP